jgi:hypothetical protein
LAGIKVTVVDPDPDYIGLEVRASSARYAATTFIYGQPEELVAAADAASCFAAALAADASMELGTLDPTCASGFCALTFSAADSLGHVVVRAHIHDAPYRFDDARAVLSFRTEAGAVGRFASGLRHMAEIRNGVAVLESSD